MSTTFVSLMLRGVFSVYVAPFRAEDSYIQSLLNSLTAKLEPNKVNIKAQG